MARGGTESIVSTGTGLRSLDPRKSEKPKIWVVSALKYTFE